MGSTTNALPRKSSLKGLGKPLSAASLMPSRLYFLTVAGAAVFCGLYLKSSILVGLVVGMTIVDILSRLMCKNILRPPFLIPTTPEEGLHQNRKLICPYWPEESILGPKAMRLGFKDVEIPAAAGCVVRGWLIPPPDKSNDRNTVLIMSHGAGRDRR
eukprot:3496082-Rhodomonas_salina.3